jgi:hypothetical protein
MDLKATFSMPQTTPNGLGGDLHRVQGTDALAETAGLARIYTIAVLWKCAC